MRSTRKIFQSVTVCGRILPIVTSSSAESTRLQQTNENQNLKFQTLQNCEKMGILTLIKHREVLVAWRQFLTHLVPINNENGVHRTTVRSVKGAGASRQHYRLTIYLCFF